MPTRVVDRQRETARDFLAVASARSAASSSTPSSPTSMMPHRVRLRTAARSCRAMASNTGCTSVVELLITLRISAGGGLLLQRLLRLVEQPHVLDRDHRLVGEGLEQRDLLSRRTARSSAAHDDRADAPCPRAASAPRACVRWPSCSAQLARARDIRCAIARRKSAMWIGWRSRIERVPRPCFGRAAWKLVSARLRATLPKPATRRRCTPPSTRKMR